MGGNPLKTYSTKFFVLAASLALGGCNASSELERIPSIGYYGVDETQPVIRNNLVPVALYGKTNIMDFYKVNIRVKNTLAEIASYSLGYERSLEMIKSRLEGIKSSTPRFNYQIFSHGGHNPVSFVTSYSDIKTEIFYRYDFVIDDSGRTLIYSTIIDQNKDYRNATIRDYYLWKIID